MANVLSASTIRVVLEVLAEVPSAPNNDILKLKLEKKKRKAVGKIVAGARRHINNWNRETHLRDDARYIIIVSLTKVR